MTDDLRRERVAVLLAQGDIGHRDVSLVDRVVALIRAERAAALTRAADDLISANRVIPAACMEDMCEHAGYPECVAAWLRARAEEERRG